jgi:hypothetical protein
LEWSTQCRREETPHIGEIPPQGLYDGYCVPLHLSMATDYSL